MNDHERIREIERRVRPLLAERTELLRRSYGSRGMTQRIREILGSSPGGMEFGELLEACGYKPLHSNLLAATLQPLLRRGEVSRLRDGRTSRYWLTGVPPPRREELRL